MGKENKPAVVAVTGAAGQIGYALLYRIARGDVLGLDSPLELRLLEIPQALDSLHGAAMELQDCAFPLLSKIVCTSDPQEAFRGADCVFLVGARPRGPGMERSDLLQANAEIFKVQGQALGSQAGPDVKVLVVGNPANTNALITILQAGALSPKQITSMTQLDHLRTVGMLAAKAGVSNGEVRRVVIWGNHSLSQFPDLYHATVGGRPALEVVSEDWYHDEFVPRIQKRGAEVIKARGSSSAASAANAAICHMRQWVRGTAPGDWTSMGVFSDGSYGIPEGIVYSFPVRCQNGQWEIVPGLEINDYSRKLMDASAAELCKEKEILEKIL